MRELHQIGESCWSNGDGACVWDRTSVRCWMIAWLLVVTTNIAAPAADAPDEDGAAAHDYLHQ